VDDTYLMLVDGEVQAVDLGPMLRRARSGTVASRADRINPAAAVTADEAFTADEVRDMWQASGLSHDELDAAANVAFELWTVEQLRK
jgi:hypothetical protein